MLIRKRGADPKVLLRLGMIALLFFFGMKVLPRPTSSFGDGLFDGINGAFLGMALTLLLWSAWLTGRRKREGINR